MPNLTKYDAFIFKIIKRYENITYIDPSITLDDLWGEAYEIYTKLLTTPLTCEFITALGRQIEQRYLDMYRTAKRLNYPLNREKFIEDLAASKSKMARIRFSELPSHMKELVRKIYHNPEEIYNIFPKNGVRQSNLIKYLTKDLNWSRKNAIQFSKQVTQISIKTTNKRQLSAQINV